jgi:rod shape-determining protein MreC
MENFFTRYRNVTVLLSLLMAQVIVLATQVRRPNAAAGESMSLMRFWVVEVFVPGEKAIDSVGSGVRNLFRNYVDLRGVREQNAELQSQLDRLRLEEVSLAEDAGQARRLQNLLAFKEKFISKTVAAQVIGTSGSEHSHVLYLDKGSNDGIKGDMAVITPRGIVGKIAKAFPGTSQVLEINDATAGAGVMLERSRLRGVLRGTTSGIPEILHIMADEKIVPGEPVVSSGGDQIYPRGLPIGTVFSIGPDPEGGPFMVVRVKPSANLDRVEEVLVITQVIDKAPAEQETTTGLRAADILAQRLPTVAPKPAEKAGEEPPDTRFLYAKKPGAAPSTGSSSTAKTAVSSSSEKQQVGASSSTEEKLKPKPKPPISAPTTDNPQLQENSQSEASSTEEKPKPKLKPPTPAPTTDKPQVQENPQSEASSTEEKPKPKPKPPTPAPTTDKPQVQENPQ